TLIPMLDLMIQHVPLSHLDKWVNNHRCLPLLLAIYPHQRVGAVKWLIQHGADVNRELEFEDWDVLRRLITGLSFEDKGTTPLEWAQRNRLSPEEDRTPMVIQLLKAAGAVEKKS